MTTAPATLPMLLEELEVRAAERLSPSFVRVQLASPALAGFGVDGPLYDQRIKLVFPGSEGLEGIRAARQQAAVDDGWMAQWYARPEEERGYMRTYTVREVLGEGEDTRLVVDFVLHTDGAHGPGGDWAETAQVGDRVVVLAPRRGFPFGGIEFAPGEATSLLLVGDETALPAIARILEDLPDDARGAAFVEVPVADDEQVLRRPAGVSLTWVAREGRPRGADLSTAVLDHLGAHADAEQVLAVRDDEIDPDLWETPVYSSSGEEVDAPAAVTVGHEYDGLYAWIAGESKVVTGMRRALVKDLGIDRHQVAFMGYWRVGVSMR